MARRAMIIDATDEKPSSLAALAYQKLHADITNGQLAPGQKLLVADLNERYGIGLSPLRDALNRLCADGLAVKREQRGFFVADIDEAAFLEITNARLVLEEAALRLSIANGDTQWEESVVLAFYRMAKVGSGGGAYMLTPEWSVCHQDFHAVLWAACGNEWLLSFCKKLYEQTTRYRALRRMLFAGSQPLRDNIVQEHKDIMEACIARNADLASELLVQHYKTSFESVMGIKCKLLENPRRLVPLPGATANKSKVESLSTT
jgi:GntR family carbon starvation induced transcriptional regulator